MSDEQLSNRVDAHYVKVTTLTLYVFHLTEHEFVYIKKLRLKQQVQSLASSIKTGKGRVASSAEKVAQDERLVEELLVRNEWINHIQDINFTYCINDNFDIVV